ncbi:BTAD domain-containing putative transcriptional regulator [Streptomyces bobili]|uniref:AfsR/SARP family transcriptional regulator n=1 Tax=Streptomyces bobili TaxID=67280 RepID=UPI00340D53E9
MEFRVLGPVEVRLTSGPTVPFSGKMAALLGMLALAMPRVVSKSVLHEVIWDGAGDVNLVEGKVRAVRRKLLLPSGSVLITQNSSYRLEAETDVERFFDLGKLGDTRLRAGALEEAVDAYTRALTVWRGEPVAELSHHQLISEVTALAHQRRAVRLGRTRALLGLGQLSEALKETETLLSDDPYWEEAHRLKVRALYELQGAHAASTALRGASELLTEEGLITSPQWNELIDQVLNRTLATPERAAVPRQSSQPGPGSAPAAEPESALPPRGRAPGRAETCLENLPPATYAKFVMRPAPWKRLEEAVRQSLPVISVIGLGGSGKSTLTREFALRTAVEGVRFQAVVWVSDRERPGTTTLGAVLDTIALTTGYPGLLTLGGNVREHEVRRILRRTPTLLIIDNYESVDDPRLNRWLCEIPEPSKALVTSIARARDLAEGAFDVEVHGLDEDEATSFYTQCLDRLGLLDLLDRSAELKELWRVADGNPRLMEWALGQVKRRGRSLRDITAEVADIEDHVTFEDRTGDIVVRELLRGSWTSLSDTARQVLSGLGCFPYGVGSAVLREVAGGPDGFYDALEELSDLCFISRQNSSGADGTSYIANPLAVNRRAARTGPHMAGIHDRWIRHFLRLAGSMGFCPQDITRLRALDGPGVRPNIEYAMTWCMENGRPADALEMARETRYYYYVRGLWGTDPDVHLLRARAAAEIGDRAEEFDALVYYLNVTAKQENTTQVDRHLPRVEEILRDPDVHISSRSMAEYRHVVALHLLAAGKYAAATDQWRANLADPEGLGPANYNANLRWLAVCLSRTGPEHRAKAWQMFVEAREHAIEHGYERAAILISHQLMELQYSSDPSRDCALALIRDLEELRERVEDTADQRYMADHVWLLARCLHRCRDTEAALLQAGIATDLYSRLGLVEWAARARELTASS